MAEQIEAKKSWVDAEISRSIDGMIEGLRRMKTDMIADNQSTFRDIQYKFADKYYSTFNFWDQVASWKERMSQYIKSVADRPNDFMSSIQMVTSDFAQRLIQEGKMFLSKISIEAGSLEKAVEEFLAEVRVEAKPVKLSEIFRTIFPAVEQSNIFNQVDTS